MRDRLVELLDKDYLFAEDIADHLLDNGVIVPPCKVGDIIYSTELNFACQRKVKGFETFINAPVYAGATWKCNTNDFGKTVFLTKDQAEQKLKEMRVENGNL